MGKGKGKDKNLVVSRSKKNTEVDEDQVLEGIENKECRCLTTDSLPRRYLGHLFGLRRVLELDDERRDSRFILVRALDRDRVITLRLVGV
jgi:hypothetical protein